MCKNFSIKRINYKHLRFLVELDVLVVFQPCCFVYNFGVAMYNDGHKISSLFCQLVRNILYIEITWKLQLHCVYLVVFMVLRCSFPVSLVQFCTCWHLRGRIMHSYRSTCNLHHTLVPNTFYTGSPEFDNFDLVSNHNVMH